MDAGASAFGGIGTVVFDAAGGSAGFCAGLAGLGLAGAADDSAGLGAVGCVGAAGGLGAVCSVDAEAGLGAVCSVGAVGCAGAAGGLGAVCSVDADAGFGSEPLILAGLDGTVGALGEFSGADELLLDVGAVGRFASASIGFASPVGFGGSTCLVVSDGLSDLASESPPFACDADALSFVGGA
ncbi:MAG: hypothetical protein GC179_02025 [Anaerolineaceae bacterium]|nr:hypothetical protein [Anaerolineaceae bacterium]